MYSKNHSVFLDKKRNILYTR